MKRVNLFLIYALAVSLLTACSGNGTDKDGINADDDTSAEATIAEEAAAERPACYDEDFFTIHKRTFPCFCV